MKVYVETNFILELAFVREEHEACEAFLGLARSGQVGLVLPSFSIGETYEAWTRRSKQRIDIWRRLNVELLELSRSKPYSEVPQRFETLTEWLNRSGEDEKGRIEETLVELLGVAEVIPLGLPTIRTASELQVSRQLSVQDSIIYASILDHLARIPDGPHCFVTKNARDFLTPEIQAGLASYDCRLFTRFGDALGYLRNGI